MLGPWHLEEFDGAIDRRPRARRQSHAQRLSRDTRAHPVTVWHGRAMTGPHVLWPPVHVDDQREYARRMVAAKHDGAALITVLHRRGATAIVIVDVFGRELTELEEHRIRRLLWTARPPKAYGKIEPVVAVSAGRYGAYSTNVVDTERSWDFWTEDRDRLSETLAELTRVLVGADEREVVE
jgi:hypothetical protein